MYCFLRLIKLQKQLFISTLGQAGSVKHLEKVHDNKNRFYYSEEK